MNSQLASLVQSFEPHPDLDAARIILASQGGNQPLPPLVAALQERGLADLSPEAIPPGPGPEPGASVARSDLATALPITLGLPVATSPAMTPQRISGPFTGPTGRFWVHFFEPPQLTFVHRDGNTRPQIVLSQGELPLITDPREIPLAGGTVWIAARMLDPTWPEDTWAGFTVRSGALRFSEALVVDGNKVTFTATTTVTLNAVPATTTANGTGCPSRASVTGPDNIQITWPAAGPVGISIGPATATFAGNEVHLTRSLGPPRLDASLNAIVFPYDISPSSLDAATLSSSVLEFVGNTPFSGGWALSLVANDGSNLTEALGPGFFIFNCANDVTVRWPEAQQTLRLRSPVIVVQQGQLILTSHVTAAAPTKATIRLWGVRTEADAPRIPLTLHCRDDSVFAYICNSQSGESVYATGTADADIDRPVTIKGGPLAFPKDNVTWIAVTHPPMGDTTVWAAGFTQAPGATPRFLALQNALIAVNDPVVFYLSGRLNGWQVDSGTLYLTLPAQGWSPTLPDPYVTNHPLPQGKDQAAGKATTVKPIVAVINWATPPSPVVSFLGTLGDPSGNEATATSDPTRGVAQPPDQIRVPTQSEEGKLLSPPLSRIPLAAAGTEISQPAQKDLAAASVASRYFRILDVSTNKDLLGVETVKSPDAGVYTLSGLNICTPAADLRVIALPQVQWEPVRTLDRDQDIAHLGNFPTPLASASDGGCTSLSVATQRLVPTIPDLAVDAVLEEFSAGTAASLITTLPFGLKASLELRSRPTSRPPDLVKRNEPKFVNPALEGGAQLAFIAESGPSNRPESSYFDGWARQLANGVALETGAPLNISVLGSVVDPTHSVQEVFNNEFSQTGARPRVPVTRLDVSGYGGSCFSEWLNRSAAYATAAKVQFQVVMARTALEVVKIATVLYPWGVLLTRTVTIERKGGGGVIRRDSGWQAASDGLFQFPGTSYAVQPGLLRGLFSVRNIRSTGLAPIQFTGHAGRTVLLAPKFFDARARIDGLQEASDLAAEGLLGFLQIEPAGEPLDAEDLRTLLNQQGAVGGPVDGVVNVGGSGFRVRATRIEVGLNDNSGTPELVGVVRGAPIFRQDGAWAAVRGPGPANPHGDAEVVNVHDVHGLPIVREGALLSVTGDQMNIGPQTDYRFCDAADLHHPDDPSYEYGFLQTSPAHTFLFPRPYIDSGIRAIRSRTSPRFADTIARATSKGLFPPTANAIVLPANTLALDAATGGFRLQDPVNLGAPRPPLVLAQRGPDDMVLDYTNTTLTMSFEETAWNVDMRGLELWTDIGGISKVSGMRSRLSAGTGTRPVMREVESLLKPELEAALTFLSGLDSRPQMGPIDLTATNTQHETELELIIERHWKFGELPSPELKLALGGKAFMGRMRDDTPPTGGPSTSITLGLQAEFEAEGKLPVPVTPVAYILLGAQIELGGAIRQSGGAPWAGVFLFDAKIYLGFGFHAGPFDGSIAGGYHLAIEDATLKNGFFIQVQAELNLRVIEISVEGEFSGLWFPDVTHPPNRHASTGGGEIQVNVELAFIGFHFGIEFTSTNYFG